MQKIVENIVCIVFPLYGIVILALMNSLRSKYPRQPVHNRTFEIAIYTLIGVLLYIAIGVFYYLYGK